MPVCFCHECGSELGYINALSINFDPTGNCYQLEKYIKHTIPSAQYYAISIFEMSGEKPFKDYFTNTLASGGIEIDDRGRKNIFWIAEKKQGYVLANGRIQGEEDGIKVVLSDYPNKIHAFPISSSSLLVRKCINCGKDIVF